MLKCAGVLGIGVAAPDPKKWGIADESLVAKITAKLSTQPPRTFTQAVNAPERWPEHVDYSYIRCLGYAGSVFDKFYAKAAADTRFKTREIAHGHAAILTHPTEVAALLVGGSKA